MVIRISEGLDLPVAGRPTGAVAEGAAVNSVALLGADYPGLRPTLLVEEGARVKLGQALFRDRKNPDILFTSPGGGVVVAINRGARRALVSVVIELDGDEEESFQSWPADALATLDADQVRRQLLAAGLWPAIRSRPFNRIAPPDGAPRSIFVTAMDTQPLAPPPPDIIDADAEAFRDGLAVVARLTEGPVHLCHPPNWSPPTPAAENIVADAFSGPHPAGLVGTHIHFLDPVSATKSVWHVGYQDVIAIGHLFTSGRLMTTRTISVAGPQIKNPALVHTRLGAASDDLTADNMRGGDSRVISGSVLSGHRAEGETAFLGRYHHQISVIAEAGEGPNYSIYRGRSHKSAERIRFTTALYGATTALVPHGGYERVMPLDILATQMLRALLTGDIEMAEALGCLELDEEDLALCTLICPGKIDYGPLLRDMLDRIEKESV